MHLKLFSMLSKLESQKKDDSRKVLTKVKSLVVTHCCIKVDQLNSKGVGRLTIVQVLL